MTGTAAMSGHPIGSSNVPDVVRYNTAHSW